MYGRGERVRKSGMRIDYRKLAGENSYGYDDELLLTPSNSPAGSNSLSPEANTMDSIHYANKHVAKVLQENNPLFHQPSSPSQLQIIEDGSVLTSTNLLNPNHPLSIHIPMLVKDKPQSIGMKLNLPPQATIRQVANIIGMKHPVTVMDVRTQEELEGWILSDLVDYFEDEDRIYQLSKMRRDSLPNTPSRCCSTPSKSPHAIYIPKVLNQISLEFSQTPLIRRIQSPQFVRDLDWIDHIWPSSFKQKESVYPRVQYYCLTSTEGCYTDFHIDFGGTSVWYHVVSGEKIFLLIPPTEKHLKLYEKWLCMKNQGDIFFPELKGKEVGEDGEDHQEKIDTCFRICLKANQTFFIPTGWIHAVYTPVDSIVIGGNFLHGFNMKGQLDVYCMETKTRVPAKFRFPYFIQIMFYAAAFYLVKILHSYENHMNDTRNCKTESGDDSDDRKLVLSDEEQVGLQVLVDALEIWAVQPTGNVEQIGSVAQTLIECVKPLQKYEIHDVENMLHILKQILSATSSNTTQILTSLISNKLKDSTNAKDDKAKPKLKLKLSMSPQRKKSTETSTKLTTPTPSPQIILSDTNILNASTQDNNTYPSIRNHQGVTDLKSRHHLNENDEDDEWTPGRKRKRSTKKTTGKNVTVLEESNSLNMDVIHQNLNQGDDKILGVNTAKITKSISKELMGTTKRKTASNRPPLPKKSQSRMRLSKKIGA